MHIESQMECERSGDMRNGMKDNKDEVENARVVANALGVKLIDKWAYNREKERPLYLACICLTF